PRAFRRATIHRNPMNPGTLHFSKHLKTPGFSIDAAPFISLGLIALFFLFASNALFVSPGLAMELIDIPGEHQEIPTRPPHAVLTVYSPSVFFFEGQNLSSHS